MLMDACALLPHEWMAQALDGREKGAAERQSRSKVKRGTHELGGWGEARLSQGGASCPGARSLPRNARQCCRKNENVRSVNAAALQEYLCLHIWLSSLLALAHSGLISPSAQRCRGAATSSRWAPPLAQQSAPGQCPAKQGGAVVAFSHRMLSRCVAGHTITPEDDTALGESAWRA